MREPKYTLFHVNNRGIATGVFTMLTIELTLPTALAVIVAALTAVVTIQYCTYTSSSGTHRQKYRDRLFYQAMHYDMFKAQLEAK
nr:MAG TPA: hypothetical protein [Caudoviricetes sp.]